MSTPQYYDPPASGQQGSSTSGGDGRTEMLRKEIEDATETMKSNIRKAGERGERLDNLQTKTDDLATQAHGFRRGANRVRKQMWWKDMKMRMCIIIGIIVLLVVIIVPIAVTKH